MSIEVSTKDMVHICHLLHEDVLCCREMMAKMPPNPKVQADLRRSQRLLLRIAWRTVFEYYDNTSDMETRLDLN
jgi:hypothetical protein